MNYYEHHIGDYAEATAHLSILEDGIYSRLLRKYYATETPISAAFEKVCRLVGARSKEEKAAVQVVLEDFFVLEEDGYHQARCDKDIAEFRAGEPERDLKRANERNRNQKHRDERAKLFKELTDAGGHAHWNIGMTELRALVRSVAGQNKTAPATPQGIDLYRPATRPATAPATPATATQTPDTRHQTPINQGAHVEHQQGGCLPNGPDGPARAVWEHWGQDSGSGPDAPTGPGLADAVQAMAAAGLPGVSAGNPMLWSLLQAGITVAELADAARAAAKAGKGEGWALARAKGKREDAAVAASLPDAVPVMDPESRAAIEADGVRLGVGPWVQLGPGGVVVPWAAYADRVRAARLAGQVEAA
jgi:uncharacterized protein YdaU (DUF1376 family)